MAFLFIHFFQENKSSKSPQRVEIIIGPKAPIACSPRNPIKSFAKDHNQQKYKHAKPKRHRNGRGLEE